MPDRNYKKGSPHRDSRTFIIVAEGEREDEYFHYFNGKNQRIKVEIVDRGKNVSAPKHFLERLKKAKDEGTWIPKNNDAVWFVLDIDRWQRESIEELISRCKKDKTLNIAISNPSFEIWLLHHLLINLDEIKGDLKQELHKQAQIKGFDAYNVAVFCPLLETALNNAKQNDTNPAHPFPNDKQTKVYHLAEQLLGKLGKNWQKY
jgi:hypothetical protein